MLGFYRNQGNQGFEAFGSLLFMIGFQLAGIIRMHKSIIRGYVAGMLGWIHNDVGEMGVDG